METLKEQTQREFYYAVAGMHRAKALLAEARAMLGDSLPKEQLAHLQAEAARASAKFERLRAVLRAQGGSE